MSQQYIQQNTGVKYIQQLYSNGQDHRLTLSSIDKSLRTVIESDVKPTSVQLKRIAKLPTVLGLTTKHAVNAINGLRCYQHTTLKQHIQNAVKQSITKYI